MMGNMIGVFDSGVGGLTVVKEIFKSLPGCQIIYFGDTARLPYGTKGADFVRRYSEKITKWLKNEGAEIIIIACNTSSAWASDHLKKEFKTTPIFEMITPAVRDAVLKTKNKKVGVIGTPGTIRSGVYEKMLKKQKIKVFPVACPLFVSLVEEGLVSGRITKEIIQKYLLPLKGKGIDTLVLACTHYPLLENEIKKVMGKSITIINPAKSLAKEVKEYIKINPLKNKGGANKFQFSDEPYNFKKISQLCFKKHLKIEVHDPF